MRLESITLACIFIVSLLFCTSAFVQNDEAAFLALFPKLIAATYQTPYPSQEFSNACVLGAGQTHKLSYATLKQVTLPSSMGASQAQKLCSNVDMCIVPNGVTLTMDANLVVGMLWVNGGKLVWNSQTQKTPVQWLCAGSVVSYGGGMNIDLSDNSTSKEAWIYIQNNGVADPQLGYRAFGGLYTDISIQGRPMTRTWSLLASSPKVGDGQIQLMHNPQQMGWLVGDRIQIAPTDTFSAGTAETYYVSGFGAGNTLQLTSDAALKTPAKIGQIFKADFRWLNGERTALMSAEVINLKRNIIITGDDFDNVQCVDPKKSKQEGDCLCDPGINRSKCTMGMHTILAWGGTLQMKYIRLEKCGQRGVLGRYCHHLHYVGECPNCIFEGNAVENGMQRGSEIHETHLSVNVFNVYSGIRGAHFYVEDGNEMYNQILYNVAVCPWPMNNHGGQPNDMNGCTVPGTFDGQADTSLNQAGFWGASFTNYLIGNRASNTYNGMLWQAQGLEGGHGGVQGKECLNNQLIGRMEGNTFHGGGRFGTYILVSVFPKHTDRSLLLNGTVDLKTCAAFDASGNDRGAPQSIYRHVDYDNVFVGQYGLGDVNYIEHISISNNNNIYWKETKNFADDCSSHMLNGYYENGNMALPSGHGSFIIENIVFSGKISLENDHHCGVGVTGILCMPTYVLMNVTVVNPVTNQPWIIWGINNGAMHTLSPPECVNPKSSFLPAGYCSLINPYWKYLLSLDNGQTCLTSADAAKATGIPYLDKIYASGILCKKPVRRLEVYTFNLTEASKPPPLELKLFQNGKEISSTTVPYFQIGDDGSKTRKQGYAMTVVTGLEQSYQLSMQNGEALPSSWIIEFSDSIFGNRWKADVINLQVAGRNCPNPVTSQHDRLWIWGDSNGNYLNVPGRGACTAWPDKPLVDCTKTSQNYLQENCQQCAGTNCGPNAYCDCGTKQCFCKSGYYGPNCQNDICQQAGCDSATGGCTMRYLGGTMPATVAQCACKQGTFGAQCNANPCAHLKKQCDQGTCTIISATEAMCTCNANYQGLYCDQSCANSPTYPKCAPPCDLGMQYYPNSDFTGANIASQGTDSYQACGVLCLSRPDCNGWAWNGAGCYMKNTGKVVVANNGVWAGTKCNFTSIVNNFESEEFPVVTIN